MAALTPQIYRPSGVQRTLAGLLCAGSWLVGARALFLLIDRLPDLLAALRLAQAHHLPVAWHWVLLVGSVVACAVAGVLLLLSVLAFLLVEGTQVGADELGLQVTCTTLPVFLSRRLGAGRLGWKEITRLEKRAFFFVLEGGGEPDRVKGPSLRFLLVEDLERLIHLVLERSPNLRWH